MFNAALALAEGQRQAYLDMACGEDAGLRKSVEELLAAYEAANSALGLPALEFAEKTFTCPHCLDAGAAFSSYHVEGIPVTVLLDRKGKFFARYVRYAPGQERVIDSALSMLVSQK